MPDFLLIFFRNFLSKSICSEFTMKTSRLLLLNSSSSTFFLVPCSLWDWQGVPLATSTENCLYFFYLILEFCTVVYSWDSPIIFLCDYSWFSPRFSRGSFWRNYMEIPPFCRKCTCNPFGNFTCFILGLIWGLSRHLPWRLWWIFNWISFGVPTWILIDLSQKFLRESLQRLLLKLAMELLSFSRFPADDYSKTSFGNTQEFTLEQFEKFSWRAIKIYSLGSSRNSPFRSWSSS